MHLNSFFRHTYAAKSLRLGCIRYARRPMRPWRIRPPEKTYAPFGTHTAFFIDTYLDDGSTHPKGDLSLIFFHRP